MSTKVSLDTAPLMRMSKGYIVPLLTKKCDLEIKTPKHLTTNLLHK